MVVRAICQYRLPIWLVSIRPTQHPNKIHCRIRVGPVHLGDRLCPLPRANQSNFSSDKQPSLTHNGHRQLSHFATQQRFVLPEADASKCNIPEPRDRRNDQLATSKPFCCRR